MTPSDENNDKTALQVLRDHLAEGLVSPMGTTMSLRVLSVGDGTATVEGLPDERFNNTMGRTHGGYMATLIDTGLGYAVATKLGKDAGFGTIELKVNYVRKVDAQTGPLTCVATVLHAGRTMLTAEAKVADKAGVLYAHGSGTFLVYPK